MLVHFLLTQLFVLIVLSFEISQIELSDIFLCCLAGERRRLAPELAGDEDLLA